MSKTTSRLVVIFLCLFTVYFALGVRPEMTPVLSHMLPDEHPLAKRRALLRENFNDYEFAVLGLECLAPLDIASRKCLERIASLEKEARESSIIAPTAQVHSIVGYDYIRGRDGVVIVSDFIEKMPETSEEEEAVRRQIRADPLIYGRLVSHDLHGTLFVFRVREEAPQNEVFEEMERLIDKFSDGKIFRAGGFGIDYQNRWYEIYAQREFAVLGAAAFLLLGVFMALVLGWRAMILAWTTILMSIIWSLGVMGRLGVLQNVLTSSLPVLLIAIVSSHTYHVIEEMRRQYLRTQNIDTSVKRAFSLVGKAVFESGFTSMLGFVALFAVSVKTMRDFGLFATAGILAGILLSVVFIPAVIIAFWPNVLTAHTSHVGNKIRARLASVVNSASRVPNTPVLQKRIAVSICILLFAATGGVTQMAVNSRPTDFVPQKSKMAHGLDILEKHFGGSVFIQVMVDCGSLTVNDPSCLLTGEKIQRYAESLQGISFGTSIIDRVKRLHRIIRGGDKKYETIPPSKDAVAQLLFFDNEDTLAELRDPNGRYFLINLFSQGSDSDELNATREKIDSFAAGLHPQVHAFTTGHFILWAGMIDELGRAWLQSNLVLAFSLFAFCCFWFRNILLAALALVPVSMANFIVFGVMGYLGITLDLANITITLIVSATAIDFYIHLVHRAQFFARRGYYPFSVALQKAIREAGVPIIFDCCSNLSFAVLVLSVFVPIQTLGLLLSLAMVTALFATLWVAPIFLARINYGYRRLNMIKAA